jgi:hypothetical protein
MIEFFIFFEKHSTNIDSYTRTSTHSYEHTHTHPTPMSTSERLSDRVWLSTQVCSSSDRAAIRVISQHHRILKMLR